MWIVTIDFMKAFDSNHNSFWDALKTCGVEREHMSVVRRFFKNQKAI